MANMRQHRWPVIVATSLALLAIVGTALFLSDRRSAANTPAPGPIHWGFPSGVSGWALPHQPFYFGGAAVVNHDPAGRPAVLQGVDLLNPSPGLKILDAYTTRPNIETVTATDESMPPRAGETLHPFQGARVPASPAEAKDPTAFGISLVLSGPADQRTHSFDGIVLRYKVGDEQYQVTMYQQARFCVTPHAHNPTGRCEPPEEHNVPDNPPGEGL